MEQYSYITLSGGGSKGCMYFGMYRALEEHLESATNVKFSDFMYNKKGFSGTSAGSLFALIMLLEISPRKIQDAMLPKMSNMRSLLPRLDITMLIQSYGLDDGTELRHTIEDILHLGGVSSTITFSDLKRLIKKDFACVATNVHTQKTVYFSATDSPDMKVRDAIYMSCCLPFVWEPMRHEGQIIVDGSLSSNMPNYFPVNETFFIDFDEPSPNHSISSFSQYIMTVFMLTADQSYWYREYSYLSLRPPKHIMNIIAVDFDLNAEQSHALITAGYLSTLLFLNKNIMPTIEVVIELMCTLALETYRNPDDLCEPL